MEENKKEEERNDLTNYLTMNDEKIEKIKNNSFIINRKIRWVILILFMIINILINFDHGTIPAATFQLRYYLEIKDSQLGFLVSLVYVGVIIGSLISLSIINIFNRKSILMISLILCSIFLFIFTQTTRYLILCIDRVIIGIFKAFISIYLPLWCDQFGIESRKTLIMGLIQVSPPFGVLVGYIITSLFNVYLSWLPIFGDIPKEQRWIFSFYIQTFIIIGVSLCLLFFSDKYFISKTRRVPIEVEETLNRIENKETEKQSKLSFFYTGKNIEELNEIITDENKNKINKKEDISFLTKLKIIFSEPLFILSVLILFGLFFIINYTQYWVTEYMLKELDVKDKKQCLLIYSIIGLTSPTIGLIVGGLLVDNIGGYRKKDALIVCLIFSFLSDLPSIPLTLVHSLFLYSVLLWIYFFLGATLIPTFQGIIIACLPRDIQGTGNCFAVFFYNLLGFFTERFFYGLVDPKKEINIAQKATVWCTFGITILVIIAFFVRFKKDKEYNEKMGREKMKNIEELNDDDAIRQGENSLGLNSKELIAIEEQDFNNIKN